MGRAGECWIAADVKRGQELAKVPKAKGSRGQFAGRKDGISRKVSGGAIIEPPETDTPTRAELGIGKKEAARSEKIAGLAPNERKAIIADLKAEWQMRAERKLGQLMAAQKAAGLMAKPPGRQSREIGSTLDPVSDGKPITLAEAGIDKHLAHRAREAAALPEADFEDWVAEKRDSIVNRTQLPPGSQPTEAACQGLSITATDNQDGCERRSRLSRPYLECSLPL